MNTNYMLYSNNNSDLFEYIPFLNTKKSILTASLM